MDILNIIFAILSIGLGCFGWLAPRYTMGALDLKGGDTTMGISEVRASAGALFVGMGVGALWLGTSEAYLLLGFCWAGASIGRLTSVIVDGATRQKWTYFAVEAVVGIGAIVLNLG
ncbi:coproporphyrinogen III oxidase [Loktanella sp. 5RATIMAR09]|uniref:DUF4345 family protein n=1 Tax=Loktanella sp. 5RATIMAR09 TaxID=1225655 RepID=UPI0006EBD59A|nr:DUF4345 family protein [Loktanella sp. 5RATIMAR09]KQI73246.1 coproporphyrinogen III oxidase [Loktanella sp. 5RATIMAR09]